MTVLGIDPGVAETGWALLDRCGPPPGCRLRSSGLVRTAASTPLPERLRRIHAEVRRLLEEYRPEAMALEEMFFLKAAHTVRASLQARGVVLLAASQADVPVSEYNPRQVKSSLAGSGTASKSQMQRMVQRILILPELLRPDDVSDAAAIALCHLRASGLGRLQVLDRLGGRAPAGILSGKGA